ncbi:hypothetical protein ACOAOT_23745 [Lacrimispora sp. AGF001]|uniref:hypothetical protein n=1 Tax=Lacrimispora sp. AGF001 TaxID=3401631 RepID=UPI003B42E2BD
MADQNEMDIVIENMMGYVCDCICQYPAKASNEEELSEICRNCQMGRHVYNILNTYNGQTVTQLQDQDINWKNHILDRFSKVI